MNDASYKTPKAGDRVRYINGNKLPIGTKGRLKFISRSWARVEWDDAPGQSFDCLLRDLEKDEATP